MDQAVKERWVKALRSGEYIQGQNYLRGPEGDCCLGVLCAVEGISFTEVDAETSALDGFHNDMQLNIDAYIDCDMLVNDKDGHYDRPENSVTLMAMNDEGKSFDTIANWIEANL